MKRADTADNEARDYIQIAKNKQRQIMNRNAL